MLGLAWVEFRGMRETRSNLILKISETGGIARSLNWVALLASFLISYISFLTVLLINGVNQLANSHIIKFPLLLSCIILPGCLHYFKISSRMSVASYYGTRLQKTVVLFIIIRMVFGIYACWKFYFLLITLGSVFLDYQLEQLIGKVVI